MQLIIGTLVPHFNPHLKSAVFVSLNFPPPNKDKCNSQSYKWTQVHFGATKQTWTTNILCIYFSLQGRGGLKDQVSSLCHSLSHILQTSGKVETEIGGPPTV